MPGTRRGRPSVGETPANMVDVFLASAAPLARDSGCPPNRVNPTSTGIIYGVRIRRSAGEHRTRLTLANRRLRRHWPPDAMPRRCREFVDSRLRRSPPDRASAVPYGQAGENAMRFPRLAHRSAAAHKLHSTPQQHGMNLISGNGETTSRLPAFSLFLPGSCPNNRDRRRSALMARLFKSVDLGQ